MTELTEWEKELRGPVSPKTFEAALRSAFANGVLYGTDEDQTEEEFWKDEFQGVNYNERAFQAWRKKWAGTVSTVGDELGEDESRRGALSRSTTDTGSTETANPVHTTPFTTCQHPICCFPQTYPQE